MEPIRCPWPTTPLYVDYHDKEWGRPLRDDARLFELFVLETMQAGLSWLVVLRKREVMRVAFDGFQAEKIAGYTVKDIDRLMENPDIIRNRRKLEAMVVSARNFLELSKQPGGFSGFIWSFVRGEPMINHFTSIEQVPAVTPEAEAMSAALKKKGFRFVGPTTCYAFMQAAGLVDDHLAGCFCHHDNRPENQE